MPNNIIPYESQVPDVTAIPNTQANASDFGGQIGVGLENIGDAGARLAMAMREHQDRAQGIEGQLSLAQLHQGTTAARLDMQNSPDAGTPAALDRFNQQYQQMYQKAFDALPNNAKVQNAFKVGAADMFTGQIDSAMQSQASQSAALQVQKAKEGLSTYTNTIQTDASQYDAALKGGDGLIAGLQLPPAQTNALRQDFHDVAIASRFDALFRAAKTPQAVAGIMTDLDKGDWKNQMSSDKFNDLLRLGHSAELSAQKIVNEQATSAVNSVEDRIKGGANIDPAEMAGIGAAVKQSSNPLLADKFARLQVQNETTQRVQGMPSAAIGQYVSENHNGPAIAGSVNDRAQDGYSYLMKKYGLSSAAAVGVLANIGRETGFDPRPGDGGTSDGYFQWHNERMTAAAAAGATGTDVRKAIDFAMSEPEGRAFLARANYYSSPAQAAQAWMQIFEKPANPAADQPKNAEWADKIGRAVNGGVPLPGGGGSGQFPSEYEWVRAQAAQNVLKQRDKMVSGGDQITAAANSGLFQIGQLNNASDFQTRAQQSMQATTFVGAKENKPFSPNEVASFETVMRQGTLDQKTALLQNVASMGSVAPAAFKQIGEKSPLFQAVGGLNSVSPNVAQDVLRGAQSMQENPDLAKNLSDSTNGPGPGGTAAFFNTVVGNSLEGVPAMAYSSRLAADALYVQRSGPGAKWNADTYTQAVQDVMGAKPNNGGGGIGYVNNAPVVLPPGVNVSDFTTMLHMLTPADLVAHSMGGAAPHDISGKVIDPEGIASEGQFVTISKGTYNIRLSDNNWVAGSGPDGRYAFQIDAPGVQSIINRPTQLDTLHVDAGQPAQASTGGVLGAVENSWTTAPSFMDTINHFLPKNFWSLPSKDQVHDALHLEVPNK